VKHLAELLADESVEFDAPRPGKTRRPFKGQKLKANEGVAGTISDNGEPIFPSAMANDERLVQRNKDAEEVGVFSRWWPRRFWTSRRWWGVV